MNYTGIDILYLTTKDVPDYLQDALYKGFYDLGCNIEDYPVKGSLHGVPHNSEYNIPHLLFNYPEKKLRKDPDLIIVTAMFENYGKFVTRESWVSFISETMKKYPSSTKVVMLDTNDQRETFYPMLPDNREYTAVFKREISSLPYPNWHSINFSSIPEPFTYVPYRQRKYDISFVATVSNFFRVEVGNFIKEKAKELGLSAFVHVDRAPIARAEYLEILSQSKTAVSVSGAGQDCYRYWEIPAKGVLMITESLDLKIKQDFTYENIWRFKGLDNLEMCLRHIKFNPVETLEYMALKALIQTTQHHTPTKRAEYILKKVFK